MTDNVDDYTELQGDPNRQAHDKLRGYVYQVWQAVYAWVCLDEGEYLVLEGAEDIDLHSDTSATATQVRDTVANISLNSAKVRDAIDSFWELQKKNPTIELNYRYLTTANADQERGKPFGETGKGLDLWNNAASDIKLVTQIKGFLLNKNKLLPEIIAFLQSGSDQEIQTKLIKSITWELGSGDAHVIEQMIKAKVNALGEIYRILPYMSENTIGNLLKEACECATKKEKRILTRDDFRRVFQDSNTQRIATHEVQDFYNKQTQMVSAFSELLAGGKSSVPIQQLEILPQTPPPLLRDVAPRNSFLQSISQILQAHDLVVLQGSSGMGKTTAANILCNKDDKKWIWIGFQKKESTEIRLLLKQIGLLILRDNDNKYIVLDDLNFSPEKTRLYEDDLASLAYTIRQCKGKIIITSQQEIPQRLKNKIDLENDCIITVPYFDEKEINDFAMSLRCPKENSKTWAKITLFHTKGHPQLVHARFIKLKSQGWKNLAREEILSTPKEIIEEKQQSRVLLQDISENQKELIYRLSLVLGAFRKDHALKIAESPQAISYPGDAFDNLVGPWIEHYRDSYFRLSALLDNVAKDVWSESKIPSYHKMIADALIECPPITQHEAAAILFHGWLGKATESLAKVIVGIFGASDNDLSSFAHLVSWLPLACINPRKKLYEEDYFVNFMLRRLQFHIELETDSKEILAILEAWDEESNGREQDQIYYYERMSIASEALIYFQVELPPKKQIEYIKELADLEKKTQFPNFTEGLEDPEGKSKKDKISILFSFVLARNVTYKYVDELIDALIDDVDENLLIRLLSLFLNNTIYTSALIDRLWMHEGDQENPEWDECIRVLKKAIEKALEWDVPLLASSAARGISVIYDEYLDDDNRAHNILDELIEKLESSNHVIAEQRATIFCNRKSYHKALDIFNEIIPQWEEKEGKENTYTAMICRKAAISAARLNKWGISGDLFKHGAELAENTDSPDYHIGFLADAAYAYWMDNRKRLAIDLFADVISKIQPISTSDELRFFTLRKRIGHILMCLYYHSQGKEPPQSYFIDVGICSNPTLVKEITQLPDSPFIFNWYHLLEMEWYANVGDSLFQKIINELLNCRFPFVVFTGYKLCLQWNLRNQQDIDKIPELIQLASDAMRTASEQMHAGENTLQETDRQITGLGKEWIIEVVDLLIITRIVLGNGNIPYEEWLNGSISDNYKDEIKKWSDIAGGIFQLTSKDAYLILSNGNADRGNRLLAAAHMCDDMEELPERLFYAQSNLVDTLSYGLMGNNLFDELVYIVTRTWLKKTENRFLLQRPQYTVPQIEEACNEKDVSPTQKTAKILLAASQAVSRRMPTSLYNKIESFISGKDTSICN